MDRNAIWSWDLYHSTALVEAAKSLVLSNVIEHIIIARYCTKTLAKVYQHMLYISAVPRVEKCIRAMRRATQCERGIIIMYTTHTCSCKSSLAGHADSHAWRKVCHYTLYWSFHIIMALRTHSSGPSVV